VKKPVSQIFLLTIAAALLGTSACGGGGGGGTTSDTTRPTVVATDPPAAAVGVSSTDPLTVTFSESVAGASVTKDSFVVRNAAGAVVSGGIVTANGRTALFTPTAGTLAKSAIYQATLTTAIKDLAGNALAADFVWSFTTTTDAWQPTANPALSARADHTAVWTGSRMIVWGGDIGGSVTSTGGLYAPTPGAGVWTLTSSMNPPSARTGHTAVWTGAEMIVWGGEDVIGASSTNTGGRYARATDIWTATTPTGAPPARSQHTAVWTGTEMIVWGGVTTGAILTNTGGRFNTSGVGSWTATNADGASGAPTPRVGHTAVWTGTEMIIWSGNSGVLTRSGARYRPATNDWVNVSPTLSAPSARTDHTAVWTGTEMIVWGGTDISSLATATGARYNPVTDVWTPMANAPLARSGHTAVWTGTEMIVWGGDTSSNQGAAYRPATDTWRLIKIDANTPSARTGHTAIWTGSEMIIWGGDNNGTLTVTGSRYLP
jgi:hypothetical protein